MPFVHMESTRQVDYKKILLDRRVSNQQLGNSGEWTYESSIEINESPKRLNIFHTIWSLLIQEGAYFLSIHGDVIEKDDVTTELNQSSIEFTLL